MPNINSSFDKIPVIYTKSITEAIKSDKSVINLARGDSEFITPVPCINYLKEIIGDKGDITDINAPIGKWTHYENETGSSHLKKAIIEKYSSQSGISIDSTNILITHGGMNAIYYALSTILEQDDEVIVFDPAYIAYVPIIKFILKNTKVKFVSLNQENNYSINFDLLTRMISSKTKALILTSPYNPCGKVFTKEEIHDLYRFCSLNNIFLVHDENHELEVYDNNRHYPALVFDQDKSHVILLNSMSRWGMGGWRVGWMIANPVVIKAATRLHAFVNMTCNTFTQEVSAFAISNFDRLSLNDRFSNYKIKRDILVDFLNKIDGFNCLLPQGTCYVFPNISEYYTKHREKMLDFIIMSTWYNSLTNEQKEKENDLIKRYKSYVMYLYLLLKCRVGVIPGCCYGEGSDLHIRYSFSVKAEAIQEAIKRMSILLQEEK